MGISPVPAEVFAAVEARDVTALCNIVTEYKERGAAEQHSPLRPVLSSLVRMALISPLDTPRYCNDAKKQVLALLSDLDVVNTIVSLLSIDFHALEQDLKREQQMR